MLVVIECHFDKLSTSSFNNGCNKPPTTLKGRDMNRVSNLIVYVGQLMTNTEVRKSVPQSDMALMEQSAATVFWALFWLVVGYLAISLLVFGFDPCSDLGTGTECTELDPDAYKDHLWVIWSARGVLLCAVIGCIFRMAHPAMTFWAALGRAYDEALASTYNRARGIHRVK